MNLNQLEFGTQKEMRLQLLHGDNISLSRLKISHEVRLWQDISSMTFLLNQGNTTFAVEGKNRSEEQLLQGLCSISQPIISWLADVKPKTDPPSLLIISHTFPGTILNFAKLDIAVDDKIIQYASKINKKAMSVENIIEWLSDQCFLISGNNLQGYAFLSAGNNSPDSNDLDAFILHGKSIRVFVRRHERTTKNKNDIENIFLIDRISRTKADLNHFPILLVEGSIVFKDITEAGRALISTQAELDRLAESEASYLQLWRKFSDLEGNLLLKHGRDIGVIEYSYREFLPDGTIRFDLNSEQHIGYLDNDQLEISDTIPLFIERPELEWPEYEELLKAKFTERQKQNSFRGELSNYSPISLTLKPVEGCEMPPSDGKLILSTVGTETMLQRRLQAWKDIRNASGDMPQLGLLIEGKIEEIVSENEEGVKKKDIKVTPLGEVKVTRHTQQYSLSPKIKNKIFSKHLPTPRQEEAIKMALNSPDILLIQGPPGTGKTTVIRAIVEGLNDILDNTEDLAGEILVTGFQHDAVENAMAHMLVNDLPPIKFGRRYNKDEYSYGTAERVIEQWIETQIERIKEILPNIEERPVIREIDLLIRNYLLSPGGDFNAVEVLRNVAKKTRGNIPFVLTDKLVKCAQDIEEDLHAPQEVKDLDIQSHLRAIRTNQVSFSDDGPEVSFQAMKALEKCGLLSNQEDKELLEKACAWTTGDQEPDFLQDLFSLKHRYLKELTPSESFYLAKVRKDVAELLGEVREVLEQDNRRSSSASDQVLADFYYDLVHTPAAVKKALTDYATIYAATCQGAARKEIWRSKKNNSYDTIIVDEAARATPLDLFIPMSQARRRIILVGDHRQLPHIVDIALERELGKDNLDKDFNYRKMIHDALQNSLFNYLFKLQEERDRREGRPGTRTITLDKQYRMHPLLGDFISSQFYAPHGEGFQSELKSEAFYHDLPGYGNKPAAWIDTPYNKKDQERGHYPGYSRPIEAFKIVKELEKLLNHPASNNLSFGIITFYRDQVSQISEELAQKGFMSRVGKGFEISDQYRELVKDDGSREERLRVGTVDAFQGKEFDVVFLSMVRSNNVKHSGGADEIFTLRRKYGHLISANRLCVSMSRQKRLLIVIGDSRMVKHELAKQSIDPLAKFYQLCKNAGRIL